MEMMTTESINKRLLELGACAGKLPNKRQTNKVNKEDVSMDSKRFAEVARFYNSITKEDVSNHVIEVPTVVEDKVELPKFDFVKTMDQVYR